MCLEETAFFLMEYFEYFGMTDQTRANGLNEH